MKKLLFIVLALVMTVVVGCSKSEKLPEAGDSGPEQQSDVVVLNELPLDMEVKNPNPGVKTWEEDGRTFYYFSWGVKNTGGYAMDLVGLTGNLITVKAVSPEPGAVVTQALTYPALAISLPKGKYTYKVVDQNGQPVKDIFKVKDDLIKINLYFPREGKMIERQVQRDPYLNNEGKTMAQIALEALFNQDEMAGYADWGINVQGASFKDQEWVILLTDEYKILRPEEKKLLDESITQTVLALKAQNLTTVVITTNPADLPPLQN